MSFRLEFMLSSHDTGILNGRQAKGKQFDYHPQRRGRPRNTATPWWRRALALLESAHPLKLRFPQPCCRKNDKSGLEVLCCRWAQRNFTPLHCLVQYNVCASIFGCLFGRHGGAKWECSTIRPGRPIFSLKTAGQEVMVVTKVWTTWLTALVAEGWVLLFKAIDVFREASLHHSFSAWHC